MADTDNKKTEADDSAIAFTDHLEELRFRLIKCFLALVAGFALCYNFSPELLEIVVMPLEHALPEGSELSMLRVTEGFMTHLKLALLAGFFISVPIWFYQAWKFIAPGLYHQEKKYVWPFVLAATLFFATGASFAFFIVMPWGLEFLLSFVGEDASGVVPLNATLSLGFYLSFFIRLILAFGLVFELPVVVFFLARIGLVSHTMLAKGRGMALVVIFIIAAILTPPDVFTQLLMAVPLIILYEISIIVARVFGKERKVEEEDDDGEEPELA